MVGDTYSLLPPIHIFVIFLFLFLNHAQQASASFKPFDLISVDPATRPDSSILMLHDATRPPEDLLRFIRALQPMLPKTRFLLPQAPSQYLDHEDRIASTWFNFERLPNRTLQIPSPHQIPRITARLSQLIKQERKLGRPRVAVFGWGIGGSVALSLYLQNRVDGCVAVSASIIEDSEKFDSSNQAPALLVHGGRDNVVDPKAFDDVKKLRVLGRNANLRVFPYGSHMVIEMFDVVAKETARFLKPVL